MNWTKREMLMQRLPAAANILALVPITGADGGNETVIHTAAGDRLTLHAATEYVLSCLAGREDKELRLIRRNAARQLARRRNIILPILHGCVLAPIMVRHVQKRLGRLGYINIARTPLIARSAHGPISPCRAARSSTLSGSHPRSRSLYRKAAPYTTSCSSTCSVSCALPRSLRNT